MKKKKKLWMILVIAAVLEIPFQIWIMPMLRIKTFENDYISITYPSKYRSQTNDVMDYAFSYNRKSYFRIRTTYMNGENFSERTENYINNVVRINNGKGAKLNERTMYSPSFFFSIREDETISLDRTEELTLSGKPAVLAIFKDTEYYFAAAVIDYSSTRICLIEFGLMPDENNEQFVRDIIPTLILKQTETTGRAAKL